MRTYTGEIFCYESGFVMESECNGVVTSRWIPGGKIDSKRYNNKSQRSKFIKRWFDLHWQDGVSITIVPDDVVKKESVLDTLFKYDSTGMKLIRQCDNREYMCCTELVAFLNKKGIDTATVDRDFEIWSAKDVRIMSGVLKLDHNKLPLTGSIAIPIR